MGASPAFQRLSLPAERALCTLDQQRDHEMRDAQAVELLELLLDRYAFGDSPEALATRASQLGCDDLLDAVHRELASEPPDQVAQAIALVRHTARRRDSGGRAHLELLHRFVP